MNLLLTGCFKYSQEQLEKLSLLGYNIHFLQQESDALPLHPVDIDAVVCNGLFLHHNIDDFNNLKFIQLTSAGFDRAPMDKIQERDISIYNARGVYSIPMAEWALVKVLEHYKQGWFFKREQDCNRWTKHRGLRELNGCKVAIVGAGNVGQEVAKRFQAMETWTCGFDVHVNDTPFFNEMRLTESLPQSIMEFDIVVITAPLLPSTYHLISEKVLRSLKDNATIVNIARGALIDEEALCQVFGERKDLYAALDVFENEPLPANSALWTLDNIAISPHNSFVSDKNNKRMFDVMYNNLQNFINK